MAVWQKRIGKKKSIREGRKPVFCENCGSELREGSKFCSRCGRPSGSGGHPVHENITPNTIIQQEAPLRQYQPVSQFSYETAAKKPKNIWKKVVILASGILVIVFVVIAILVQLSGPEQSVKSGYFERYPDKSIGEAFSDFFAKPTWTNFTGTDGNTYVQFTGECVAYNELVETRIVFLVNEGTESFEVMRFRIDGELMSLSNWSEMLDTIYE